MYKELKVRVNWGLDNFIEDLGIVFQTNKRRLILINVINYINNHNEIINDVTEKEIRDIVLNQFGKNIFFRKKKNQTYFHSIHQIIKYFENNYYKYSGQSTINQNTIALRNQLRRNTQYQPIFAKQDLNTLTKVERQIENLNKAYKYRPRYTQAKKVYNVSFEDKPTKIAYNPKSILKTTKTYPKEKYPKNSKYIPPHKKSYNKYNRNYNYRQPVNYYQQRNDPNIFNRPIRNNNNRSKFN